MKLQLLTCMVALCHFVGFGQETFAIRIAPQASIDLSGKNAGFGFGTQITFVTQDRYKDNVTFLLEGGYTLKTTNYGDSKLGSTTKLHGVQITPAFEFGDKWTFAVGPYMNMLMGIQQTITIESKPRNLTRQEINAINFRNVDLGITLRTSRQLSSNTRIEFGLDSTLVNAIENAGAKLYPLSIWGGLRFKI